MNRRLFLKNSGAFTLSGAVAGLAHAQPSPTTPRSDRKRALRIAHLTDLHVMPDEEGRHSPAGGMAAAIRHAQGQADRPDYLFFGGDMIMDSLNRPKPNVLAQWEVWQRVFSAEVKLPHKSCLGNHDIWAWEIHDQPAVLNDPQYGKRLALEQLSLPDRYYSFDLGGWHFVVLDSMEMSPPPRTYLGRLDDQQFAWLAQDLARTPSTTPVCMLSHIPILSACSYFDGDRETTGEWVMPNWLVHIDARRIKDLFYQHRNVKVCLSGHLHLEDDVTYLGVRYLCNGSVCGNWWRGRNQEFAPAYALVDFYDDGSVENQLVPYLGQEGA